MELPNRRFSIVLAVLILACVAAGSGTMPSSGDADDKISYSIDEQRGYGMASADGTPPMLANYFAQGTVTVGAAKMEVVGGIVLDGVPMIWVHPHNISRQRITVEIKNGAFPKLPSKNEGIGIIASASATTGVEFSEALFMSSAPAGGGNAQQGVPPFFYYLSPLSGASWQGPKDAPPDKSPLPLMRQATITAVVPDLYAYRSVNNEGKATWTRRAYFVATKPNTLSKEDLVRIEEVELPDRTEITKGVFLKKAVIALQGIQGVDEFPGKFGTPLKLTYAHDLTDAQKWYVEDGEGKKDLLLKQDVDSSGNLTLIYENGISISSEALTKLLCP